MERAGPTRVEKLPPPQVWFEMLKACGEAAENDWFLTKNTSEPEEESRDSSKASERRMPCFEDDDLGVITEEGFIQALTPNAPLGTSREAFESCAIWLAPPKPSALPNLPAANEGILVELSARRPPRTSERLGFENSAETFPVDSENFQKPERFEYEMFVPFQSNPNAATWEAERSVVKFTKVQLEPLK
jgi:hypothetical protein